MKKLKLVLTCMLSALFIATIFSSCGDSSSDSSAKTEIYYLNFKPEVASVYEEIAKKYQEETGVKVNVVTAASGGYEQTLKSEIAKENAPTIFQINGPVGYQSWRDYCLDLKDTEIYTHLLDKELAVVDGDGVYGIPYVVEGYGIIYNDEIMRKYFALPDKVVDISSAEEITDFHTLKSVVEDMTAKKDVLGIAGVFSSTSLSSGEQWRWHSHLANIPMYHEFKDMEGEANTILTGLGSKEITFKYSDYFKNIFDLYIENSVTDKGLLGSKSTDDSMAEFALGKSAMVQNGNWAWSQISEVAGNVVKAEDIKFMPIYTGIDGEENYGICVGTENYLAVNKMVSEEKQKASLEFLNWLFTSDTGKDYVVNKLGFIAPFDSFENDEQPQDPLGKEVLRWMNSEKTSIPWSFASFPSDEFKTYFGDSLLEYAQGTKTFDDIKTSVIQKWKTERAK